jgi:hypothetical protein
VLTVGATQIQNKPALSASFDPDQGRRAQPKGICWRVTAEEGLASTVMAPFRHLPADVLRRLGACIGVLLVLALFAGLAGTHRHAAAQESAAAVETVVAADMGDECPHEAHHQHHDAECCLGLGCAPAMVPGAASFARPGGNAVLWPLAASAIPTGDSGGQFRPPRLLLTA